MSGPSIPETDSHPEESNPHSPKTILEDQLDEYDYQIFEALNENGRMSDTELADRVGLSRTAVRRRRENLSESGILEILAVIVLQEADLAYADVRIRLCTDISASEREEIITTFVDADLVYSVDSVLGDYDLFVRGWHSSLGQLKSYFWDLMEEEAAIDEYDITPVVTTWKAWDRELDPSEQH